MADYVYGIVEDAAPTPSEPGLGGAALRLVRDEHVAALVSDLPAGPHVRLGRDEVTAHARVLEAALTHGTVLPMRFGVVMETDDEVRRRLLDAHVDRLRAQLQEFAQKVEINIRATYQEAALMREIVGMSPEISRLREALRGKPEDATYYERIRLGELVAAAIERTRERDAGEILDALSPLAADVAVGEPAHERIALSASFLIERGRLRAFDDAVERVAEKRFQKMRFKYTGPLPPHSFVDLGGAG